MSFNNVNEIFQLAKDTFEILKNAKKVLLGNKPEAEKQLAETLNEIHKFYQVLSKEISSFQSISFEVGNDFTAQREKLSDIRNGGMLPRITEARGNCYKIKAIYDKHLSTWFNEAFRSENEQLIKLNQLFEKLTGFDEGMFRATDELSNYLRKKAGDILSLLENKNLTEADKLVWDVGNELTPLVQSINKFLVELTELKNEFSYQ